MVKEKRKKMRRCTVLVHLCLLHDFSDALQSFVRKPSDQYVREGQTVVLPCQASEPVGQVQWTRDEFGLGIIRDLPNYPRYRIIGNDLEGIYSLEVQRATLEDDAVFECQVGAAAGQQGIRSPDARLTVLVPPEPPRVIQGDQVTTAAGLEVRLQCESRSDRPPAELRPNHPTALYPGHAAEREGKVVGC
ncbi:irregular chiasm C-roughest protein-like [Pollicipes pollicipes]|uniref:irregular chiasm C-roughest protein-like n=1 Tax=Pollicipes pollicipes TaxID=41117 RepID=UPI001884ABE6|nr:irregular chiasm C-roughest protein-like [Pollicipes pollicipes]